MQHIFLKLITVWMGLISLHSTGWAQAKQDSDHLPYYYNAYTATHTFAEDGRKTSVYEWQRTALKQEALEQLKQVSYSFSTSVEKGEFLEAYTLKKNGRRIDAPAGNYQISSNNGRAGASPLYSDRTSHSVVLADLEVGDAIHIKFKLTESEPLFANKVSFVESFSPFERVDSAVVEISAPSSLGIKYRAYGYSAQGKTATTPGLETQRWVYSNTKPRPWNQEKDEGIWKPSEGVSIYASNISSHQEIASMYGERALPKAKAATQTARVKSLGDEIVQGVPKDKQAQKIYEWVSHHITYGGNCIGVGAVVPRDVDVVLDNKLGDCKDHATLLQALLATQGIRSEQVLVNAGGSYEFPELPVVSAVNHVMNYLPDTGLYVDATAKAVPFGRLPFSSYGKPVLHVDQARANAVLPQDNPLKTWQTLNAKFRISETGAASGTVDISIMGSEASSMRYSMQQLSSDKKKTFIKDTLAGWRMRGRGTLSTGDADQMPLLLSDQYGYSMTFEIDDYLKSDADKGSFILASPLPSNLDVMIFSNSSRRVDNERPTTCHGFWTKERIEIELPAHMKVISLPRSLSLDQSILGYKATYTQKNRQLIIEREIKDKTATSICQPEFMASFYKQEVPIARNLSTPFVYELKARK